MAKILETKDIVKLIERNSEKNKELNSALILSASIWGMKSSEISLITIGDTVDPSGNLKSKWLLRKEVSHNGYARELYTEHKSLVDYLNTYLDWRVAQKHGTTNMGEFRGLDPEEKLFLTNEGFPFKFTRRSSDNNTNLQPTGMNLYFQKLIKNSGITGLTYKDFRNSLAINMNREGHGTPRIKKTIMEYLGIRSYDALIKIINNDPKKLHQMIKGIYNRI
jgi:hypothetical protein